MKNESTSRIQIYIQQQATIRDKNYGKNCYLDNFVFLLPSAMLKNNEQKFRQAMLWVCNIV